MLLMDTFSLEVKMVFTIIFIIKGTIGIFGYDPQQKQIVLKGLLTQSQKIKEIYSMLYANNHLYVGGSNAFASFRLNIQSNICDYEGELILHNKVTPENIIGLGLEETMLIYIQAGGAIGSLQTTGSYASCGTYFEKNRNKDKALEFITASAFTSDLSGNKVLIFGTNLGKVKIFGLPKMEFRGSIEPHTMVGK